MTNEEAIKYLIAPTATSTEPSAEYLKQKEAYDLAIKALETGEVYMTGEDYNLYMEGYKAGKKDFEPKQGKWIDVVNSEYPSVWHYECSECHGRPLCTPFTKEDFLSKFCPHCGAEMRGKEE